MTASSISTNDRIYDPDKRFVPENMEGFVDSSWFSIELRDPATPSFCTYAKDFWGDESSITAYLKSAEKQTFRSSPAA